MKPNHEEIAGKAHRIKVSPKEVSKHTTVIPGGETLTHPMLRRHGRALPRRSMSSGPAFGRTRGRTMTGKEPPDDGAMTSDAGALLLGATNKMLGLTRRLSACVTDRRDPDLIEHGVETLLMRRITGIALGYEDLNDHDEPRHDRLRAAGGKEHTEPPRTEQAGADPLRQDRR